MSLKALLGALPSKLAESPIRAEVTKVFGDGGRQALLTETTFLLKAQEHLEELNKRYFPLSGKSQQEVVEATAARVGLRMPEKLADDNKPS